MTAFVPSDRLDKVDMGLTRVRNYESIGYFKDTAQELSSSIRTVIALCTLAIARYPQANPWEPEGKMIETIVIHPLRDLMKDKDSELHNGMI